MAPDTTVRGFFERMQARDWAGARALVRPSATIIFTATSERFSGGRFVDMNEAYPEGWSIEVVDCIAGGDRVAAQVRVTHGDDVFWCAGFYTVAAGAITAGVEHWVAEGAEQPPSWRDEFTVR